jgi:hypothetical protein
MDIFLVHHQKSIKPKIKKGIKAIECTLLPKAVGIAKN